MWIQEPRVLRMMHHPGRVWMKLFVTNKAVHAKVTDCEFGEWDGNKTTLSFYPADEKWQGHLYTEPLSFSLTERQAQAMFDGMFDWLIDWWRK